MFHEIFGCPVFYLATLRRDLSPLLAEEAWALFLQPVGPYGNCCLIRAVEEQHFCQ